MSDSVAEANYCDNTFDGDMWGAWRLAALRSGLEAVLAAGAQAAAANGKARTVAVIGAGFAGLSAAYFLHQAGFDPVVFEASDRVGGRVWSEDWEGTRIELGAELIGVNFALWRLLADTFKLDFEDLRSPDSRHAPITLRGRTLDGAIAECLRAGMASIEQAMAEAARYVDPYEPWSGPWTPGFTPTDFDEQTLEGWARDQEAPADWGQSCDESDHVHTDHGSSQPPALTWTDVQDAFMAKYAIDNVAAARDQSLLAALCQVAGGGGRRFAEDQETHRCIPGNDELADKLRETLAALAPPSVRGERVRVGDPVTELVVDDRADSGSVRVKTRRGDDLPFDYAVLTVPPPMWDGSRPGSIAVTSPHGDDLLGEEFEVAGGPALKYFCRMTPEFWAGNRPYDAILDDAGVTWRARPEHGGHNSKVLCLFAGDGAASNANHVAPHGEPSAPATPNGSVPPAVSEFFGTRFDAVFGPGTSEQRAAQRLIRWDGDADNYVGWGYACPKPTQVGNEDSPAARLAGDIGGRLVFAGEHTCPAFYGYMEGALQSGLIATGALIKLRGGDPEAPNPGRAALEAACRAGSSVLDVRVPLGSYVWTSKNIRLRLQHSSGACIEMDRHADITWSGKQFVVHGPLARDVVTASLERLAHIPGSFLPPGTYLEQLDPSELRVFLIADCQRRHSTGYVESTLEITAVTPGAHISNEDGHLTEKSTSAGAAGME